jgi:hypothetical protein
MITGHQAPAGIEQMQPSRLAAAMILLCGDAATQRIERFIGG